MIYEYANNTLNNQNNKNVSKGGRMCEKLICDFCCHSLPENHFYSKEDKIVCNWCFGEMVGVRYGVDKSQFLDNGEDDEEQKENSKITN